MLESKIGCKHRRPESSPIALCGLYSAYAERIGGDETAKKFVMGDKLLMQVSGCEPQ